MPLSSALPPAREGPGLTLANVPKPIIAEFRELSFVQSASPLELMVRSMSPESLYKRGKDAALAGLVQ